MKIIITYIAGFLSLFISATIIAILMQSTVAPMFGIHIRTEADGLDFAPLIIGYAIVAAILLVLVKITNTGKSGWLHGAIIGAIFGVGVFLGDHLITAGWSKLAAKPMLISGILDSFAVILSGTVIGTILKSKNTKKEH